MSIPIRLERIRLAREQYEQDSDDDIRIDADTRIREIPETRNFWAQAWVYVRVDDDQTS